MDLVKVLDIENIKIIGKNKKYIKNRRTGQLILSDEYRKFKKTINVCAKRVLIDPPYFLYIRVWCSHDIDGIESGLIDGLQGKAYENDKDILFKITEKNKIKRNQLNKIQVFIMTYNRFAWIYQCVYCGNPTTEYHHQFPQTKRNIEVYGKGLIDAPFNRVPACNSCNVSHKNIEVWTENRFRDEAEKNGFILPAGTKSYNLKKTG